MKKTTNKWWLVMSMLALCAAPALVSCSDDDDDVTVTPGIEISKFTISAAGGESVLAIAPTADWKAESKTAWLKLSPASGTVADKEIKLTAEPNTTFESREATIELTVGGTAMTKTIVQEATQKYISIYSDKITFAPGQKEITVSPIISNVKVIVGTELPAWISEVKVTESGMGYYEAVIKMKDNNYDDALRADTIIFKDAASDYEVKFPIECAAVSLAKEYRVIADVDSGVVIAGDKTVNLEVMRAAGTEQDTILIYMKTSFGFQPVREGVSVSREYASPSSALLNSRYKIDIENLRNAYMEEAKVEYRVYVLSVYDVDAFQVTDATPCAFAFARKNTHPEISALTYECTNIKSGRGGSYLDLNEGEATLTVTFNTELCADVRILLTEDWPDEGDMYDPFGNCMILSYLNIKQHEAKSEGNYKTVVYKINVAEGTNPFMANLYIAALSEPYSNYYSYFQLNGLYIMRSFGVNYSGQ